MTDHGAPEPGPRRVDPPELARPSGFSHATVSGRIVALAGQTALDRDGRITGGDVVEQFDVALGNLLAALAAAGGEPGNLMSVTIYAVDLGEYRSRSREVGAVWTRLVGRVYPAMCAVGVSRLWDVEALVEVQGWAVLAEPDP